MATKTYTKYVLTGGGTGALDAIDGDELANNYRAMVITTHNVYHYILNSTSGATADGFNIIAPATNAGLKRWILKNENFYSYPDYSEADQGVTGNNNTLKYYVDTINTDNGTILLRHNSGDATTTYTFSTNETIPANITVKVENGAVIAPDTGVTVTINGDIDAGLYQIFDGAGSVKISNGKRYTSWWGNGSTALASASASLVTGATVVIDADQAITDMVTFNVNDTIIEKLNDAEITYTGSGTAVRLNGYRIKWPDIKILNSSIVWTDGTDTTSIGLEIYNTRYSEGVLNVEGFHEGVVLHGYDDGTIYNDFRVAFIYDCRRGVVFRNTNDSGTGWSNSNTLRQGDISYRGNTITTATANAVTMRNVIIENNSYSNNSNQLVGVSLQGFNSAYLKLIDCDGQYNDFYSCRYEVSGYDATYTLFNFGANSIYNKLIGGRWCSTTATLAESVTNNGTRNWFFTEDEMSLDTISMLRAGQGEFLGNYAAVANWAGTSQVRAKNSSSSNNYLWSGEDSSGVETSWVRGFGQRGTGIPRTQNAGDSAAYVAMDQLKGRGYTASYSGQDWRRTTAHGKSTGATGIIIWQITVPADTVMQVVVNLVGRKTDNSKYLQMVLRGVFVADGAGASTLGASNYTDPAALNVGTFDVTDCVLVATGATGFARLVVGGNEIADYYFSAMVEWQIVNTES